MVDDLITDENTVSVCLEPTRGRNGSYGLNGADHGTGDYVNLYTISF